MSKKEENFGIGNRIDSSVLEKLKQTKKELKLEEKKVEEAELERKRKEQKEREKNKSFSELFEESNLDWKNFK